MGSRVRVLRMSEDKVLEIVSDMDGWVCAKAIAARMGWPWRIVARALRRLAERQEVEARREEVPLPKSRVEARWVYHRTREISLAEYPHWLCPKVPPHMQHPDGDGRKQ